MLTAYFSTRRIYIRRKFEVLREGLRVAFRISSRLPPQEGAANTTKYDNARTVSCLATRRVSLASESDLGEYKDSEIQRWLVGMLSTRGFQNHVPIDSVLSVTLLVGDSLGLGHVIL